MELPSISASSYTSQAISANLLGGFHPHQQADNSLVSRINQLQEKQMGTRIVKVFVADPNENLQAESRLLYSGEEKLSDLTDQELFFEIPIQEILSKHNEVRKGTIDRAQAEKFGRDIFLEPARIRDLKMVVVTVAQF